MERRRNNANNTVDLSERNLHRRAEDRIKANELKRKHLLESQPAGSLNFDSASGSGVQAPADNIAVTPEEAQNLVHQLRVHQIELEMQNEELRHAQWEMINARERYFNLYDLAPIGYCSVSEGGLILETNFLAANLLGCERGTLVNEPITHFIVKSYQDDYYLHRRSLKELQTAQTCELRMINRTTRKTFWAHIISAYESDLDEQPVLRMVITDISERKEAAAEVERLDRKLKQYNSELTLAKANAEKANMAKTEFLSSMSHELRNPLSAILGFAQLLESGAPSPTVNQKRSIDQILKAGWYLLDLINEILDLALIESGKLTVSMEPVLLHELMLDCGSLIHQQAKKRGIELDFSGNEQVDAHEYFTVQADYTRLKQVLINLLSNAIKYNVENGRVAVSTLAQRDNYIRICIDDTGIGLSRDQMAELFQPFNRLGQEEHNHEGTGIGLVITKRLVELMGGKIGVESDVGKGSRFWIELELAPTDPFFVSGDAQVS